MLVQISENLDFRLNFFKILIVVKKISKYLDFGQKFRKIAILVKIFENLDFGDDFRNISD